MTEVRANLNFANLRRGDRIQVDINDPTVAGLIEARYLTIIWKEPCDAREAADTADPAGADRVPDTGVAGRMVSPQKETAVDDGADQGEPAAENRDSTPSRRSTRAKDKQPDSGSGEKDGPTGGSSVGQRNT